MNDEVHRPTVNAHGVVALTSGTAAPVVRVVPSALRRLQDAVHGRLPLDALNPVDYAAGHALFESRSDQRAQVTRWLVEHFRALADRPTRVLSIGCGDGSVDSAVAAALTERGHNVEYVGVEPHVPSARAFLARLAEAAPRADVSVLTEPFEHARPVGHFDVVLAVHSLYYVADLGATLRQAHALLAAGGEFIVLHAPLEPLNALVRLLSPGRQQPFGAEVESHLSELGQTPEVMRLDSRLDLSSLCNTEIDRRLVAFTVQAQLPPALLPLVRAALTERARPEPGLILDHPVDAYVIRGRSRVPTGSGG